MLARPEVMECYLMTGDADYLLRVVVSPASRRKPSLALDAVAVVAGRAERRKAFANLVVAGLVCGRAECTAV